MAPHSSTLPGKSHGRRSLVGCGPQGHEESDTTEQLHFHFSLSCIGEGNSNPPICILCMMERLQLYLDLINKNRTFQKKKMLMVAFKAYLDNLPISKCLM